jgi:ubiquinone/menaquinone biosynthesis C-methylase UbiE
MKTLLADYSIVAETPSDRVTTEALEMSYSRYRFARDFCAGGDVLEIGCGAGQGLGYLAKRARKVVGGDVTANLLRTARTHYGDAIPLIRLDAERLPFASASFDVVLLYEAIYYLNRPEAFLTECRRVLRPAGQLVVCTVNCEWQAFNPSPFSVRYFSASELAALLEQHGFRAELAAGFPESSDSFKTAVIVTVKRAASSLRLIPHSMRGKRFLKRLFLGRLVPAWQEVEDGRVEYREPQPLNAQQDASQFKILYAVGRSA